MKKKLFTLALAILLAWPLGSALAVESFVQPSGVLQYNAAKSYGGYQLFSGTGAGNTTSYLIDMEGYVVQNGRGIMWSDCTSGCSRTATSWPPQTPWSLPLPPGVPSNVKIKQQTWPNGSTPTSSNIITVGGGHGGFIQEFDWNGNVVWEYELNDAKHVQHHTITPSPWTPGNMFILGWEYKTNAECIAAGRNPATISRGMWPDYVIESTGPTDRLGVPRWDNLVQNFDPTKPNYGQPKDHPDKWDINWIVPGMAVVGSTTVNSQTQDWTHWNTANYHPTDPNKIVTNSRHMGESYIIDKAAKKLIWRFGNPNVYGAGKAPSFMNDGDQLIWVPHMPIS